MIWWLPSTWLEDLGEAKRVSFYRSKLTVNPRRNNSWHYTWYYHVECDLRLPDGTVVTESVGLSNVASKVDCSSDYDDAVNKLRKQIRIKYQKSRVLANYSKN